jgi:hypothetical protein
MDTLHVLEPKVLVHFLDDENGYVWHHRLLLKKFGGGVWIGASPDGKILRLNKASSPRA